MQAHPCIFEAQHHQAHRDQLQGLSMGVILGLLSSAAGDLCSLHMPGQLLPATLSCPHVQAFWRPGTIVPLKEWCVQQSPWGQSTEKQGMGQSSSLGPATENVGTLPWEGCSCAELQVGTFHARPRCCAGTLAALVFTLHSLIEGRENARGGGDGVCDSSHPSVQYCELQRSGVRASEESRAGGSWR